MDRPGDMAGYVAAKEHIFDRQQPGGCAVIGVDDEYSRAAYGRIARRLRIGAVPVALDRPIAGGISFRAGMLVDADGYSADFSDVPTLPGDHHAQNAAAAWAACRWLRVTRDEIVAGLASHPGLPHPPEGGAPVGNVGYGKDRQGHNCDGTGGA